MKEILGEPVHRSVASIGGDQFDIVDVFRRPADVPQARCFCLDCWGQPTEVGVGLAADSTTKRGVLP